MYLLFAFKQPEKPGTKRKHDGSDEPRERTKLKREGIGLSQDEKEKLLNVRILLISSCLYAL